MNERSTEVLNNYASRVFNDGAMRRYLPGDTYKKLKKVIADTGYEVGAIHSEPYEKKGLFGFLHK